jgi:hypothetical protein
MRDIKQCKKCGMIFSVTVFFDPKQLRLSPRPAGIVFNEPHHSQHNKSICGLSAEEIARRIERRGLQPWPDDNENSSEQYGGGEIPRYYKK